MESLPSNHVDDSPQLQPPPPAETPADGGGSEHYSQKISPGSIQNYSIPSYSYPLVDPQFQNQSEENLIDSQRLENGNSNGLGHQNDNVASAGDGGRLSKLELPRPLLSDAALTNTHSGTDKDQSGGEEETTSRRRRRSRWDPPPTDSSNDGNSESCADSGTGTGGRKRKSRWSDDQPQPVIQLPDFMRELTGGIEFDPEIQALNARLLEITRKMQSGSPLDDRPEGARSPSPEPIYDNVGIRINTREYRAREKLTLERQEIISQMIKKNPAFKPPADYRPPKLHRKLYIPMKEYPGYNFIGLIIGPRGNTQKRMERETGAKIVIRGKGSVKEGKWLQKRDMKPDPSENEDLHVLVEADTQESLDAACAMLEKLLQPVDEVLNEHKRQQLRELATLNGTIRDEEICRLCGEPGHRQYACPSKNSTFKSDVLCKICGDGGHPTIDCPVKNTTGKKMDDEYQNFLAELGGSVPESATKQTSTLALGPGTSGSNPPWSSGGNTAGLGYATGGDGDGKPKEYDETNLYIGYLPPTLDDGGLISLFSPYGEIVMAKVIKDRVSQLSKGYGFVKYADVQQANNAIASMNGHRLEGRTIAVRVAGKPPPPAVPPGPPAPAPAPAPSPAPAPAPATATSVPSYMLPGQPTGFHPLQQHTMGGPIGNAPVGSFTGAPPPWGAPMPHPYAHYPPPPGANMYPPTPGNPVSLYALPYHPHLQAASSGGLSRTVSSGEGQQSYSSGDSLSSYPPGGHSICSSPLPSVPSNVYGSSVSTAPTSAHYSAPSYSLSGYYGGVPPSQQPPPPPPHIDQSLSFSNVPWASHQPAPPPYSSSAPDAEYEKFMADMK